MKKILITGSSGFFGKNILNALGKSTMDFECICLYNRNKCQTLDQRFESVSCNILDPDETENLFREMQPTHLVHLAWDVEPQKFWDSPSNLNWVNASVKMFHAFGENGGQVFLGAGSIAEYDWTGERSLDENRTPLNPATIYGQSKKSLHESLLSERDKSYPNIKIIWPRIGYFFGLYEPKEKLIPKLIEHIKTGMSIDLCEPNFRRPYADIKYAANIIVKLLESSNKDDLIFNLSADQSYELKQIVSFIERSLGKESNSAHYNKYPSTPLTLDVDTHFLQKEGLAIPDTFFSDLNFFIGE